jgi:hypothetical protein
MDSDVASNSDGTVNIPLGSAICMAACSYRKYLLFKIQQAYHNAGIRVTRVWFDILKCQTQKAQTNRYSFQTG